MLLLYVFWAAYFAGLLELMATNREDNNDEQD
jgi:hypothetical protein